MLGDTRYLVSVFDDKTGRYTYYRVPAPPGRPWGSRSPYGTPVRAALPPLPADAQYYGVGDRALGTVVLAQRPPVRGKVVAAVLGAAALAGLFWWAKQ